MKTILKLKSTKILCTQYYLKTLAGKTLLEDIIHWIWQANHMKRRSPKTGTNHAHSIVSQCTPTKPVTMRTSLTRALITHIINLVPIWTSTKLWVYHRQIITKTAIITFHWQHTRSSNWHASLWLNTLSSFHKYWWTKRDPWVYKMSRDIAYISIGHSVSGKKNNHQVYKCSSTNQEDLF